MTPSTELGVSGATSNETGTSLGGCTCGSEAVRLMYGVERGCPMHDYHAARRAASQTSTVFDASPADRAASPSAHTGAPSPETCIDCGEQFTPIEGAFLLCRSAQKPAVPTDLATSTPDPAVDVAGTTGPTS